MHRHLAIATLAAATLAALPAHAQWRVEVVAPGTKPDLVVDATGVPHVVYMIEDLAGGVYRARRDASGWAVDTIATGYFYGPLDVELAPDDALHVAWHDHDTEDCGIARTADGGWRLEQVADPGHDGWDPTLLVEPGGRAHVASIDPSQFGTTSSLEYAVRAPGGGWAVEKIGSGPVPYAFGTAIALDAAGRPLVAWHDGSDRLSASARLLLAARDPAAGWSIEVVDDAGDAGKFPSIAVGRDGRVHLASVTRTGGDRGRVRYAVGDGAGWTLETVAELPSLHFGHIGARRTVSLALDAADRPVIAWCDRATLALARRGDDGSWASEIAYEAPSAQLELGQLAALELGPDGAPHVAFYELPADPTSSLGTVMYATRDRPAPLTGPVRRATGRVGGGP